MLTRSDGHGLGIQMGIRRLKTPVPSLIERAGSNQIGGTVTYDVMRGDAVVFSDTKPMRSFVGNLLRLLYGRFTGDAMTADHALTWDGTDADESEGVQTNLKAVTLTSGLYQLGIVVGTSSTAVGSGDYTVTIGDAADLTPGTTVRDTATTDDGVDTVYFKIRKDFNNTSGDSITVKEAGIAVQTQDSEGDEDENTIICREVMNGATGYTIADGERLRVTFTIFSSYTANGGITVAGLYALESGLSNVGTGHVWAEVVDGAGYWSARYRFGSCVFNGKMWVIGGYGSSTYYNDVWYSSDGESWTRATASAGWSARMGMGVVVYNSKMWVFGGSSAAGRHRDVWYSSDGATWTQATSSASWAARWLMGACVYDGKMWIAGGNGTTTTVYNDVWYSTDGATWTRTTDNAAWSDRMEMKLMSFDGKMWMFGGQIASSPYTNYNEIYYTTNGTNWYDASPTGQYCYSGADIVEHEGELISIYSLRVHRSTDGVNWDRLTSAWNGAVSHYFGGAASLNDTIFIFGGLDGASQSRRVWKALSYPFSYAKTATMPVYGEIDAAAGEEWGLMLGTDDTAYDPDDTTLGAKCGEGTGAGSLEYGAMAVGDPGESGDTTTIEMTRLVTNNSGDTIPIYEIGLIIRGQSTATLSSPLFARVVLGEALNILNGETVEVWASMSTEAG